MCICIYCVCVPILLSFTVILSPLTVLFFRPRCCWPEPGPGGGHSLSRRILPVGHSESLPPHYWTVSLFHTHTHTHICTVSTEVCLQTVVIDSQTVSVVLTEQLTIYKLYLLYKCFFIFRHHCVFLSILGLLCNKNMMLLDNKPRYCNLTGTTRTSLT